MKNDFLGHLSECYKRCTENTKLNAFLYLPSFQDLCVKTSISNNPDKNRLVIGVKDNISVENMPLTCGSKILEGYTAPYSATVIERLEKEGHLILGKTNLDEFAMGSSSEYSAFGPVLHPLDNNIVPGGSSGGSAVAVATKMCDAALGSDTGGSVRQPAAFCGVVGYKPTYGRVSRYGLVAFASSLEQIGVIANDVRTVATVAMVISGYDAKDATTINVPVPDYLSNLKMEVKGVTFGVPEEYISDDLPETIRSSLNDAVDVLRKAGAIVRNVSLPHTKYVIPCYTVIAMAEASSNLARFDGGRFGSRQAADTFEEQVIRSRSEGFGTEVKRRIMLGTFVLSEGYYDAYYDKATRLRQVIRTDFTDVFSEGIDLLIMPTTPELPFCRGEKSKPLHMYTSDLYTASANLAGIPAISIPWRNSGLPTGIQLMGPDFSEELLFRAALFLETSQKSDRIQ